MHISNIDIHTCQTDNERGWLCNRKKVNIGYVEHKNSSIVIWVLRCGLLNVLAFTPHGYFICSLLKEIFLKKEMESLLQANLLGFLTLNQQVLNRYNNQNLSNNGQIFSILH